MIKSLLKPSRFELAQNDYKYYSFFVGLPSQNQIDFKFYDLKIPAQNHLHAVKMFSALYMVNTRKNILHLNTNIHSIRRVAEYELNRKTHTRSDFTLLEVYSV